MKKVVIASICLLLMIFTPICYAEDIDDNYTNTIQSNIENTGSNNYNNTSSSNNTKSQNNIEKHGTEQLVEIKEKTQKKLEDYKKEYGSDAYGLAAYILNIVRIYSIPFCFIGIAIGAIYQYVIGIHKMDERDKGFTMIISFVTILVIAQVLPLIFAIVVKGWRD